MKILGMIGGMIGVILAGLNFLISSSLPEFTGLDFFMFGSFSDTITSTGELIGLILKITILAFAVMGIIGSILKNEKIGGFLMIASGITIFIFFLPIFGILPGIMLIIDGIITSRGGKIGKKILIWVIVLVIIAAVWLFWPKAIQEGHIYVNTSNQIVGSVKGCNCTGWVRMKEYPGIGFRDICFGFCPYHCYNMTIIKGVNRTYTEIPC